MDDLAAQMSAHEIDTCRRGRAGEPLTARLPQRPEWIFEALPTGQRHASPGTPVQFHEPRPALIVPQKLQHEHPSPADAREQFLTRDRQTFVDLPWSASARPR